ncbi:MAG: aldo/keto reductase [Solobacterium sp.]|nr:aldo/keto reductase [Solobacterium sp.]
MKLGSIEVPRLGLGCMRIASMTDAQADTYIRTALDEGLYFFDHADIYGGGQSEIIFGKALKRTERREDVVLQSKCGIRRGMYDLSGEYILSSVDGILERLQVDYLDVLVLHRPDALMEPEEIAEAFDQLKESGKVREFGVSNMNSRQIELLQKYVHQKIITDQMQLSLTNCSMIREGINVNIEVQDKGIDRDGNILDYCRLNDITIQTWSPLQYGMFSGTFLNNPDFPELNAELDRQAEQYGITKEAVACAWILRHPAKMQVIVGSTNPARMHGFAQAEKISMTREDWYRLYIAAGNRLP